MNKSKDTALVIAFGCHVRMLRKTQKMSMEKLAEKAEIDYRLLAYIEKGEINTTISTVYRLAKGLNLPLQDLFNFEHIAHTKE